METYVIKDSKCPYYLRRRSIKIKNSLYSSGDMARYKLYRNKVLMLTRISKKSYFHKYFEENFTNIKKTWEGINDLLGRKQNVRKNITSLKCPGNDRISYNSRGRSFQIS